MNISDELCPNPESHSTDSSPSTVGVFIGRDGSIGAKCQHGNCKVHNINCGRLLTRFPRIVLRLRQILQQFPSNLYYMNATIVSDETLDRLPIPSQIGRTRVGGIDLNKPRTRAVLSAFLSLAEFTTGRRVRSTSRIADSNYDACRADYDIKKFRGRRLVSKLANLRRYAVLNKPSVPSQRCSSNEKICDVDSPSA